MPLILDGTNGETFPSWTTATRPASPAVGQMGYNTTLGQFDQYVSSGWQSVSIGTGAVPQVTVYTSGSGTYTTPTGARAIFVRMVGGGSGGYGGNGGAPGNGGNSTFGASLAANGGANIGGGGATGGDVNVTGGGGAYAAQGGSNETGGNGGSSAFGGNGAGVAYYNSGTSGYAGGGGAGGGTTLGAIPGPGGGAGGYLEKTISSPAATYSYAVGAAGTAGSAGTNGKAGATGGPGLVIVTAYF